MSPEPQHRVTAVAIRSDEAHSILFPESLLSWLSAVVTLSLLGWLLWFCRYGIDVTDESYYLVWMSNPQLYSTSATQFGFIYHPLYQLLGGNIAALRQANILLNFLLAWTLCHIFLKTVFNESAIAAPHRVVVAAAIATASAASLVYASHWLPTPSYNGLSLQAFFILCTGWLLSDRHTGPASIIGWIVMGCGGWLAFMAKPTTAAAAGLCTGFYLVLAGKLRIRLAAVSVATALVLTILSAFTIDGSIMAFVHRLKSGIETYAMINGHQALRNLLRLDEFSLGPRGLLIFVACTLAFFSAAYFSQAGRKATVRAGTLLCIGFAGTILAMVSGLMDQTLDVGHLQGLLMGAVPSAAVLTGGGVFRIKGFFKISRANSALVLALLAVPYAYAFGTAGNYWVSSSLAVIFWVLAGLVWLNPIRPYRKVTAVLLPLGLAVQLMTAAIVHSGIETPYRQPQSLRVNDYALEIGRAGSTLLLASGFGEYLANAIRLAKQAGFRPETPMIDLTGQSPGVLYAVGAKNIGQPWTIGGYPGSDALAAAMLKKVGCPELAAAWLLAEPEGPRHLSPEVLSSFKADMTGDYETVGTFQTAEGAGGYQEARTQHLLKPVRRLEDAIHACLESRAPMH